MTSIHYITTVTVVMVLLGLYLQHLLRKHEAKKADELLAKRLKYSRGLVLSTTRVATEKGSWSLYSGVAHRYISGEPLETMSDMDKYVLTLLILEAESEPTE